MAETTQDMRVFKTLWLARLVLQLGTSSLFYTLVFWIYLNTRSVTTLALFFMCITIPSLVMAPLARALVQRWHPRWSLTLSHGGALLALLALFLLLRSDQLMPWQPHLAIATIATFFSMRVPAHNKALTAVVPEGQRDRATMMDNIADAIAEISGQLASGILLLTVGLLGVVTFSVVVFILYLIVIQLIRIPNVSITSDQDASPASPLDDVRQGWRYIISQPGLFALLIFFAITNLSSTMVQILIVPLGLTVAAAPYVGATLAFASLGPLISTLLLGRWGPPKRLIHGVLGFTLVQGLVLLLGGFRPSLWLIGLAAFVFLACYPFVLRSSHTIWEKKVPLDMHRRAFAMRRAIAWSSLPFAQLLVGPLSDRVFVPLLSSNSSLAGRLAQLIGDGPGRGLGILFMVLGLLVVVAVIAGYAYPRLRLIEDEMPNVANREKDIGARTNLTNAY